MWVRETDVRLGTALERLRKGLRKGYYEGKIEVDSELLDNDFRLEQLESAYEFPDDDIIYEALADIVDRADRFIPDVTIDLVFFNPRGSDVAIDPADRLSAAAFGSGPVYESLRINVVYKSETKGNTYEKFVDDILNLSLPEYINFERIGIGLEGEEHADFSIRKFIAEIPPSYFVNRDYSVNYYIEYEPRTREYRFKFMEFVQNRKRPFTQLFIPESCFKDQDPARVRMSLLSKVFSIVLSDGINKHLNPLNWDFDIVIGRFKTC